MRDSTSRRDGLPEERWDDPRPTPDESISREEYEATRHACTPEQAPYYGGDTITLYRCRHCRKLLESHQRTDECPSRRAAYDGEGGDGIDYEREYGIGTANGPVGDGSSEDVDSDRSEPHEKRTDGASVRSG